MASGIGIKIANGEFYSIVDENSQVKKRLVLTTVHDNQQSVQIDLYKSYTRTMADAFYIGSLVLENIKPKPKGEPSIELVISSVANGDIAADAVDLDASSRGEHHTLNVSLKSLDEDNREYEIPDFELEQNNPPPSGLYDETQEVQYSKEKKGFPWLIVVLAALVLTAIGLVIWLFFFKWGGSNLLSSLPVAGEVRTEAAQSAPETPPPAPPAPAQTQPATPAQPSPAQAQPAAPAQTQPAQTQPAQTAPVVTPQPAAPPPVIQAAPSSTPAQAPASSTPAGSAQARSDQRQAAPVASYNVPSNIPPEGVPYRIRYGDTLWDIAEAFYRNPWQYPRIARFNNIRNPDLIISGTTILVPPRN